MTRAKIVLGMTLDPVWSDGTRRYWFLHSIHDSQACRVVADRQLRELVVGFSDNYDVNVERIYKTAWMLHNYADDARAARLRQLQDFLTHDWIPIRIAFELVHCVLDGANCETALEEATR